MNSVLINKIIGALPNLILMLILTGTSTTLLAAAAKPPDYDKLNTRFDVIAADLQQQIAQSRAKSLPKSSSIQQLEIDVKRYLDKSDSDNALNLILLNLALVKSNLDDRAALFFISLLLDYNQLSIASELFGTLQRDGEKSLKSNANYLFANYYFNEKKWQKCLQLLEDGYADLPEKQANHARLIAGVSLQQLKDHRKAITIYERIPPTSEYYFYARLNIAVAYIRQGWWTDAQTAISNALKPDAISSSEQSDELTNRLYLVLGYSLLQKEYYRDAREAFRNITTNSRYSNRALLGIALASANQDDLIGALNALSALKNQNTTDLSIDESYLLYPFIYNKLGQELTATTSYNEAIKYYQDRIANLDKPYNRTSSGLAGLKQIRDNHELVINDNLFDLSKSLPESFLNNPARISQLLKASGHLSSLSVRKTSSNLVALDQEYKAVYKVIENQIIEKRKEYLNSYLNQSRYGLANLFDKTLPDNK